MYTYLCSIVAGVHEPRVSGADVPFAKLLAKFILHPHSRLHYNYTSI